MILLNWTTDEAAAAFLELLREPHVAMFAWEASPALIEALIEENCEYYNY